VRRKPTVKVNCRW